MRVHFTGGALTSYGVTPAEYTTSNPFIQKVIENSPYFREGRITLLRRATIEEPKKAAPKAKAKAAPQAAIAAETKDGGTVAETSASAAAEAEAKPGSEKEAEGEDSAVDGLTKIEVSCLPDAQAYIQENFNIATYKVRNCETAQKIGAEHGIEFTGGKFEPYKERVPSKGESAEE